MGVKSRFDFHLSLYFSAISYLGVLGVGLLLLFLTSSFQA